jgi:UDP-2-acetamido-2,6-beta-L-arabino-hexul-4-ose reductase
VSINISKYGNNSKESLEKLIEKADIIFHLAGVNRPEIKGESFQNNIDLAESIAAAIRTSKSPKKIIFSSSVKANQENEYGRSKLFAENLLSELGVSYNHAISIYRLPNIYGENARPFYNSVVATFCYQTQRSIPLTINEPERKIKLVYVHDVISAFFAEIGKFQQKSVFYKAINPVVEISVSELAKIISTFPKLDKKSTLKSNDYFFKTLYQTYLSYS